MTCMLITGRTQTGNRVKHRMHANAMLAFGLLGSLAGT